MTLMAIAATLGQVQAGVLDLEGRAASPLAIKASATVLLFVRIDCPISNRYAPEVHRLHDEFAPRGVTFWLVYPDEDEPVPAIRRHIEEYGYRFDALRDTKHELVKRTGATVTPEVAVFDASGRQVYRGRIDDRYVDFGKTRPEPTVRDLRDALTAVLEGRTVEVATTKAVGCFIPPR
jgi:hypothetical protein